MASRDHLWHHYLGLILLAVWTIFCLFKNLWIDLSCADLSGVHDSYWTHACDVDRMNTILREKFVELYEMPILENVRTFLSFLAGAYWYWAGPIWYLCGTNYLKCLTLTP